VNLSLEGEGEEKDEKRNKRNRKRGLRENCKYLGHYF
jgi:hypothetical protein